MAIYADKNLYSGVNPHLHSRFQTPPYANADFRPFHLPHLVNIGTYLNRREVLPATYYARTTLSLLLDEISPLTMKMNIWPFVSIVGSTVIKHPSSKLNYSCP
jgi:hypothetical protein